MRLNVCLASAIHDPDGHLASVIGDLTVPLRDAFTSFAFNITTETHADVIAAARDQLEARIVASAANESLIGLARRNAVAAALESSAEQILYSDFDHIIGWLRNDAAELRRIIVNQPELDMLVIGRSAAAFAAEPQRLQETERVVNHIYYLMTGHAWDLMFAIRRMSRPAAELVVSSSTEQTLANDVEWPFLIERAGMSIGTAAADGLHYRALEDVNGPDRRDGDYLEWIRRMEFAAEHVRVLRTCAWFHRVMPAQ